MTEAEKYRPNPCGIPRWEDPTRFVCRCFTFADEAVKSALKPLGTPTVAIADIRCGKPGDGYGNGRAVSWLMGELCDQLAFECDEQLSFDERDERSRARRAADLIGAFRDFMQWSCVPLLERRHTGEDTAKVAAALEAVLRSIDAEAMALAATPDEFRQRLTALLDLDAAAQPTTAQAADGDEIARKVADAVCGQFKDIAAKPRKDKGGKHTTHTKRISECGRTARVVADDFNKSRFVPERGAPPMGGCTEEKIKQWDAKYPDAEHAHPRWGYYADLRLLADLKNEYGEVLQNWARYWADYKIAFKEWRKAHPASRRESFRFTPMKKANGYNPEWIGRDENGTIYNAPTK